MAGRVLDISKHDDIVRTARSSHVKTRSARLYRFPSRAPQAETEPAPLAEPIIQPVKSRFTWRSRLAIELAIGFTAWLIWFWWHMLH